VKLKSNSMYISSSSRFKVIKRRSVSNEIWFYGT